MTITYVIVPTREFLMSWIDDAKSLPFAVVAGSAGMMCGPKMQRWTPCPSCGEAEDSTGRNVVRSWQKNDKWRWKCNSCLVSGDVIDLASIITNNCLYGEATREQRVQVRKFFAKWGQQPITRDYKAPESVVSYPNSQELMNLWDSATPVDNVEDKNLSRWLASRRLMPTFEARMVDRNFDCGKLTFVQDSKGKNKPWFPSKWKKRFPLLFPLYDNNGQMKSVQARTLDQRPHKLKSVAPVGHSCRGLFFANFMARNIMSGISHADTLWIVEGEVDYASVAQYDVPVIGIKSGSIGALKAIRWPEKLNVIIATDCDEQGHKYAERIIEAVAPLKTYRIDLENLVKEAV